MRDENKNDSDGD